MRHNSVSPCGLGATAAPWMVVVLAAATLLVSAQAGQAAEACEPLIARVVSLQGRVEVQPAGAAIWTPATLDQPLCVGDTVRAGPLAKAALALTNDSVMRLDQLTTLRLGGEA